MKAFARLYATLEETNATGEKVAALAEYFRRAPPEDAAWAVHFLIGRRPRRLVAAPKLGAWASEAAGIPGWLYEESYAVVGDLAETITLLLPDTGESDDRGLRYWVERLLQLRDLDEAAQREDILRAWRDLGRRERFVWNKLITGGFRVGVSGALVERALSLATGVPEGAIAHRLTSGWEPTAESFARLCAADVRDTDVSRPYPFFLAYPLEGPVEDLGPASEWLAEWKWDGIRAQLIRRAGRTFLWSRGDELLNGRFPELEEPAALLSDGTVLDGELLPWLGDRPLPFAQLQRRIGRKTLTRKLLDEVPVALVAYDLLEEAGEDVRPLPLQERRRRLAALLGGRYPAGRLVLSPAVEAGRWAAIGEARERARDLGAEGLMLKRLGSPYGVGRRKGEWWKWRLEPYAVDAVLMYAQAGSGGRAGLFTDYTFGVWDEDRLVAFAKAYSGLTDAEIRKVDAFVRRNTLEKHGPVRAVRPELVFELAFEGIQASPRHKSGVAVRFPRIARWRTDKRPEDADTLATVRSFLSPPPP